MLRLLTFSTMCCLAASGPAFGQCRGGGGGGGGGAPGGGLRTNFVPSFGSSVNGGGTSAAEIAAQQARLQAAVAAQQSALQSQFFGPLQLASPPCPASTDDATAEQAARREQVRERLRLTNAERALAAAQRAEARGRMALARREYRRVMTIVPGENSLARVARDSLARLEAESDAVQIADN